MAGVELGKGYVTIQASTRGMATQINRDLSEAGKSGGAAFASAFKSKGAEQALAGLRAENRKLANQVAADTQSVKKARSTEEQATRQVQIAEAKLSEVRGNSRAKTSQLLAAEDRVKRARDAQRLASERASAAAGVLDRSQVKLKQSTDDVASAARKAESGLRGVFSRLGGGSTLGSKLFGSLKSDAGKSGGLAGQEWSGKFASSARLGVEKQKKSIFGPMLASAGGNLIAAGIGAVGSAVSASLSGGMERAANIEQARASLKGLGNDAKTVDEIMKNATASVRGTAFGLGDAAGVAASATAAGIKPGKELQRTLSLVGDVATIAKAPMNEIGAIFNKVAANGKLGTEEMNQLSDRGIPVLALLQKQTGKTAAEVRAMVTKGQVDFATFQNAMEKGMGGAAQQSGKTFTGAMANAKAAMSRLGASALTPIMSALTTVFQGAIPVLDQLGVALKPAFDAMGRMAERAAPKLVELIGKLPAVFAAVAPIVKRVAAVVGQFAAMLWRNRGTVLLFGSAAAVAFGAFKSVGIIKNAVTAVKTFGLALKAAFVGNPVGLVLVGIVALVAGLIYAYKHSDRFRSIVNRAFAAVKTFVLTQLVPAFQRIWATIQRLVAIAIPIVLRLVGFLVAKFKELWPPLKNVLASIWGLIQAVFMRMILPLLRNVFNVIKTIIGVALRVVMGIWNRFGTQIMAYVKGAFNAVVIIIKTVMNVVAGVIRLITAVIKGDWRGAWEAIKSIGVALWNGIKAYFVNAFKIFQAIFGGLIEKIKTTASAGWEAVKRGVTGFLDGLAKSFTNGVAAISKAWEAVKDAAKKPVRFVAETVYDNGIRKAFNTVAALFKIGELSPITPSLGFASGGILPGYTPGRDVHHFVSPTAGGLHLSGGEAIMRPEFSRAVGAAGVATLNRAAQSGPKALNAALEAVGGHHFKTGGLVNFQGGTFTQGFANALAMAQILAGAVMHVTQGGWRPATSYSGTSHAGDAIDISGAGFQRFIGPLRAVGIPTWDRTGKGNWMPHAHGVPLPGVGVAGGSAIWQAQDYLRGGDGLGGRDNGPRGSLGQWSGGGLSLPGGGVETVGDPKFAEALKSLGKAAVDFMRDPIEGLKKLFKGPLDKLAQVADSKFGQIAGGTARWLGDSIAGKGKDLLGLRTGGVVTRGGLAALSEDGRPELVVGPQLGQLSAGARVFNADQTARMMAGGPAVFHIYDANRQLLGSLAALAQGVVDDNQAAERRRGVVFA